MSRTNRTLPRMATALAVLAIMAAACGTRVTDGQVATGPAGGSATGVGGEVSAGAGSDGADLSSNPDSPSSDSGPAGDSGDAADASGGEAPAQAGGGAATPAQCRHPAIRPQPDRRCRA